MEDVFIGVFEDVGPGATVYFVAGTNGWGATFGAGEADDGDLPTAVWDSTGPIGTDVTAPGDPILLANGANDGDGDAGPPPAGEGVGNAIDDSPAGTYPITVAGGADPNYTITRRSGTLTVTEGDPVEAVPTLAISRITRNTAAQTVTLTWASEAQGEYAIELSEALDEWDVILSGIPSDGATTTATIQIQDDRSYFRVQKR